MGFYINPKDTTKEFWLQKYGELAISISKEGFKNRPSGKLPVILVDNGGFMAAGICYSEEEYKAFTHPEDKRPRTLYFVDEEKLLEVCPDLSRMHAYYQLDKEKSSG